MRRLVIRSENEAWAALEAATSGESLERFIVDDGNPADQDSDAFIIIFDGWPDIEIDFKGRDWHSSVPTRVMAPLLDIQHQVYRAFTEVRYGEPNLRRLTDEDREKLELVVKVKEGSSVFNAALAKQLTTMAEAAIGRMDGTQALIAVLTLALCTTTAVMYKAWLNHRIEAKKIDKDIALSAQETKRQEVMAAALTARPALQSVKEETEAVQNRLLKSLKPGDSMELGGVRINSAEAEAIVKPERDRSTDVYLQGVYRIVGNRTDKLDGFLLRVKSRSDDTEFNAEATPHLDAESLETLRKAEWEKVFVELRITASLLRGAISNAVISSARIPDVQHLQ